MKTVFKPVLIVAPSRARVLASFGEQGRQQVKPVEKLVGMLLGDLGGI